MHDRSGVRQQRNDITSFIDASNVYGANRVRANALRTLAGDGKLKTSRGNFLPFNTLGLPNAPDADRSDMFLAGDIRANEQLGLTAMHTIFVREHNRLAQAIAERNPFMNGEDLYQLTRAVIGGLMQKSLMMSSCPCFLGRCHLSWI